VTQIKRRQVVANRQTHIKTDKAGRRIGSRAAELQATHTSPSSCKLQQYRLFAIFTWEYGYDKCFFSQSSTSKPNELIFNTMFYHSVCLKRPRRGFSFGTVNFCHEKVPNFGRSAVTRNVSSPAVLSYSAFRHSPCQSVPCLRFSRNRKAVETSNLVET